MSWVAILLLAGVDVTMLNRKPTIFFIVAAALTIIGTTSFFITPELEPAAPAPSITPKGQVKSAGAPASAKLNYEEIMEKVGTVDGIQGRRINEINEEWLISPHGPIAPESLPDVVEQEFPDGPPETALEIVAEIARMYRGESPFTNSRIVALHYLSTQEPIASEIKNKAPLPIPQIENALESNDVMQEIAASYNEFNRYFDFMIGHPVAKINLSSKEYKMMRDIIHAVERGELPDSELPKALPAIKRMLQDIDYPHPDSNLAKMESEELAKLRARYQDLLDRAESYISAP